VTDDDHAGTAAHFRSAELRSSLVDRLMRRGTIKTASVERAMRTVPRHLFLPGVDEQVAYADEAVALKWSNGRALSSVSQPTMVASMLEMLDVHRGARVLEIGTGSGYNAALLSELAGDNGVVVSIELDGELAEIARSQLASAGYRNVEVHAADGRAGWPAAAPYDRIVVTASAPRPEPSWEQQLADGGRMVVPLARELEAVIFDKVGDTLVRNGSCPALFIPLR
jgi:protein-L-isoaspartate(D-aspartate) O-methyltransferase